MKASPTHSKPVFKLNLLQSKSEGRWKLMFFPNKIQNGFYPYSGIYWDPQILAVALTVQPYAEVVQFKPTEINSRLE